MQNVPFASKKVKEHLNRSIKIAKEIGAELLLGNSYLDLGLFYQGRRRIEKAQHCIAEAIKYLESFDAEILLKEAKEAMRTLA